MINAYHISKLRGGKVFISIWVIILTVLLSFLIIGFLKGDLLGYIAFSIIPAAILLNISIIIAHTIKEGALQISKTGWSILCIAVLIFVLAVSDLQHPNAHEEVGMIVIYSMGTLSFPLSFFVIFIYAGFAYLFDYLDLAILPDIGIMDIYVTNFILWLCFFIAGYLQWFKLFPFLMEKWQARRYHTSYK